MRAFTCSKPLPPGRHPISVRANYANPDARHGEMVRYFDHELDIARQGI